MRDLVAAFFAAFVPHPAVSFAAAPAIQLWRLEGFGQPGRTYLFMTPELAMDKPAISLRSVARKMRNFFVGLLLFLVVGNLIIFGAFKWMAATDANYSLPPLPGIKNLTAVDGKLWRGSAPTEEGYAALARKDVKVIVDLRAEDLKVDRAGIKELGMRLVRIPMRDGQAPTDGQVQRFLSVMNNANGRVYVHCGAGVGRTGTMSAAYLVLTGRASSFEAVQRNLAVGPPSLEQIAFAAGLDEGEEAHDVTPLTIVSRVLDAPRRLLVRVRHSYQ